MSKKPRKSKSSAAKEKKPKLWKVVWRPKTVVISPEGREGLPLEVECDSVTALNLYLFLRIIYVITDKITYYALFNGDGERVRL